MNDEAIYFTVNQTTGNMHFGVDYLVVFLAFFLILVYLAVLCAK